MTRLEKMLNEKGLKQTFIAKKLGVNKQSVSHWVTGRHKMSAEILLRLSELLDVEPKDIFGDVPDEPEE